jgi:glycosyltransferase involved in cell wall biosynthesis
MGAQLRKTYPACTRVLVVSNAALIEPTIPAVVRIRESLKSIGFLSNVSEEKGIFDFLGVVRQLERTSSGLVAKLAGPFDDATTEARVREWLKSLLSVEYLGPQYAKQKSAFFDNLDVLLFPTRYANEASPVTLHEAMAYGVPVIAYGRGSIDELVVDGCGLVIGKDEDFVKQAVRQLEIWKSSPQTFQQASHAARDQFDRICSLSRRQWAALQAELC